MKIGFSFIFRVICGEKCVPHYLQYTFILLSFSFFNRANCQSDWTLARNRNGVQVYTKNYKSSGLKQLKAETTITGISLHTIAAVFKDIDNTKKWTSKLKHSRCLKNISTTEYINYFVVDIPWPLKKREGIFKVHMSQDPTDGSLMIESNVFPEFMPENDTNVRILEAKAIWIFLPLGDNKIKIQSVFYADPRGFPPFLVNLFVTDAPLETMTNLREYLKLDKYKNAKFDFIHE